MTTDGRKDDAGKPRPSLIPRKALLALCEHDPSTRVAVSEILDARYQLALKSLVNRCGWENLVRVLEFGASKYGRDNWRNLENAPERYLDAALRHLLAIADGEENDVESGLQHIAHAACCIAFLLELDEKA